MIDPTKLGDKIRYFRKRAGLTQGGLELKINLAPGSISRIENNKINPTKETILDIAKALKLNSLELNYLIGPIKQPVTSHEVDKMRDELKEHLKAPLLLYVVDERSRIWFASDLFIKIFKLNSKDLENIYGKNLLELLMANKILHYKKIIPPEYQEKVLYELLTRMYREMHFMIKDPYYLKVLKLVKSDPLTRRLWGEVKSKMDKKFYTLDFNVVYFKIGPKEFKIKYSVESLLSNERFRIVQYHINSKLISILNILL